MPFKSEKQRRYLWKNDPKLAREWEHKYGNALVVAAKKRLKSKTEKK